jgi:hypothetical protein
MWREMGDKASTPSTVAATKAIKLSEDDRPSTIHKQSAVAATGAA